MGTDLFVRKEIEQGTDDKGRKMFSKVEVANFRGCRNIIDTVINRYELANCSSVYLSAEEILEIKDDLEEDLKEAQENKDNLYERMTYREENMSDEEFKEKCEARRQRDIDSLMNDIDEITSLIEEEKLTEDSDACYEFHLWY